MTVSLPGRCLWCLRAEPEASFNIAHVLPECVGNHHQQVLPAGLVCKGCNADFGRKVERALLEFPSFHVAAVFVRAVDPAGGNAFRDKVFDAAHPPAAPPSRTLKLDVAVRDAGGELVVDVTHTVQGQFTRRYSPRDLALISRRSTRSPSSRSRGRYTWPR